MKDPVSLKDLADSGRDWSPFPVHDTDKGGSTYAPRELQRIAGELERLGMGYTRMEQCVMNLVREIRALVLQNAAMLESIQPEEEEESEQYLGSKRR